MLWIFSKPFFDATLNAESRDTITVELSESEK